ncbi:hypothetical protein ACWDCC_16230 [Streptomyces sp. NPDC001102]
MPRGVAGPTRAMIGSNHVAISRHLSSTAAGGRSEAHMGLKLPQERMGVHLSRGVLAALFLLPAVCGVVLAGSALASSSVVRCPGENVGEDGEERPGPMRPGDTHCSVLRGNVPLGERTYEEQRAAQHEDRLDNLTIGSGLAVYGLVGVTIVCCGLRRRTA